MFQFVYPNIAYHPHTLIIYVSSQYWESIIVACSRMLE